MATLLRPPLVSDRQPKRPIGYADIPPNLIASTLRIDVLTLKQPAFSVRLSDSAPPRPKQTRHWETPNLLTSTLFQSTEKIRLGMEQWDDSAPPRKIQVQCDLIPNLLTTTLGAPVVPLALPLNAVRWDWSAPWRKAQVFIDLYPRLQQNTLAPTAAALDPPLLFSRLSDSAPSRRYINQVEQLGRAVWRDPVPAIAQLSDSATPRKPQVRIDTTPNPVVLLQPLIARWFESAPPRPKVRVQIDQHRSLNVGPLAPAAALAKPLGYPYDFSTYHKKYAIQFEPVQNVLVRGFPISSILEVIPYLIGSVESQATQMLTSIYMVVSVVGSGGTVVAQSVEPFSLAARGTTVIITMGGAIYSPLKGGGNMPYNLN